MTADNLIQLPRKFWNDRNERGLPMPKAVGWSGTRVTVDAADPVLADYLDDAEYYSGIMKMSGDRDLMGLQASARATVKAIKAVQS